MSLLSTHKAYGNLRTYDVTPYVNLHKLRPAFERLQVDPYLKEGYRRKHIAWFERRRSGTRFVRLPDARLYQSKLYNPVHGGLAREYPPIAADPATVHRLLSIFVAVAEVPVEARMLLQLQRITTTPDNVGKPSVENWHQDGVNRIGIICVARDNITGGLNEFRAGPESSTQVLTRELPPGHMAVFDDGGVFHRVTDIHSADQQTMGYRDVVLMSY